MRHLSSKFPLTCCCSVVQSCLALWDHMGCMWSHGFPDLHHLPELVQTHVHWVGDAIQPSRPLLSASPSAFNPSQNHSLFQGASASASVLQMNIQDGFPLGLTSLISLLSQELLTVFSNTTAQKHQFFGTQPSLWSNSHIHNDYWQNHSFDYMDLCWQSKVSAF